MQRDKWVHSLMAVRRKWTPISQSPYMLATNQQDHLLRIRRPYNLHYIGYTTSSLSTETGNYFALDSVPECTRFTAAPVGYVVAIS